MSIRNGARGDRNDPLHALHARNFVRYWRSSRAMCLCFRCEDGGRRVNAIDEVAELDKMYLLTPEMILEAEVVNDLREEPREFVLLEPDNAILGLRNAVLASLGLWALIIAAGLAVGFLLIPVVLPWGGR